MHAFPSPEWVVELKSAIDKSQGYRQAAATWNHGAVALVIKADAALGVPDEIGLWLDLAAGVCREAKIVTGAEAEKAAFCIRGDYAQWKSVLKKELDPIKAMMQKKLELKGLMTVIVKYVNASKELVECATRVPTRFLDDK